MDKEKNSPSPGRNIFENAASLIGVSPFGLPYASHLAHLPGAYSLMGHHPAFPVSSLFGGLGENPFGSISTSLATSVGSTILPSPILSLGTSPLASLNIAIPDPNKSDPLDNSAMSNTSSKSSPSPSKGSPKTSKTSRSSPKTTVTKATTTIATTTTTTFSNSVTKKPKPTTVVSGSTGVSLLSGKMKKSNKVLEKLYTTSLLSHSANLLNSSSVNGSSKSSKSSTSVSTSASSPTHSLGSPQSKSELRLMENGVNISESDHQSDVTGSPSPSSDDESAANGISDHDRKKRRKVKHTSSSQEDYLQEMGNGSIEAERKANSSSPSIHIDGLKKKLIADQIRQRVQNKTVQSVKPSIMQPMKRGRGRPPKNSVEPEPTQQQLEVIREYKRQQEELKRQLEANLKQQQMQLKIMKRAQAEKEKEASIKVQKLLEASVKQAKASSSSSHKSNQGKHRTPRQSSGMSSPSEPKQSTSKSSQLSSGEFSKHSHSSSGDSSKISQSETLVARFKTLSEESSELSDSDMESDSESVSGGSGSDSDREPRLKIAMDSDGDIITKSRKAHKSGSKRCAADDSSEAGEGTPSKRPRVQMDEKELKIPMSNGWQRQTTILAIGKRGFIGEVLYFAPCGKKLKTIPDVMRYIDRHSIKGMGRENFSFNTKVNVGSFYEARHGQNGVVKLTDQEVLERMALVESKRQKMLRFRQQRGRKRMEKQNKQLQLAKQMMEQKLKRKMEQQEMARRAAEYKLQKKLEKDRQRDMINKIKQLKAMEQKKQKEQLQLMREQEKLQRQEQMRIEREMRAQQVLESNLLWYHMERERELKRQQAVMIKEQERERKRQHLLLVKALEAQKKQAERDRLKEEKINEKRIIREKKMEQKRLELQMARELKKPTEDMELLDSRPLPEFPRIPGLQTDSQAFADIMMVLEFLHNFADVLGYDKDTLPTLKSLQDGILGKTEDDTEDFIALVSHLLKYAVTDPGVPNPKEAVTRLGQKIMDIEITDPVVSEILRVFMVARNGGKNEMSEWLIENPLDSLSHIKKAAILAFLCNELLCGKAINAEIDKQLDRMGDIRRDKWVVEGKLRRLRIVQAKKFHRPVHRPSMEGDVLATGDGDDSMSQNISVSSKKGSDEEEEKEEESDSDEDGGCSVADVDEDDPVTLEECEKQIEKLQKTHAQYRAKVFRVAHKLRAINFGQDRYKRRYWALPCSGGVYVEGLETGKFVEDEEDEEEDSKKVVKQEIKIEMNEKIEDENKDIKKEVEESIVKEEKMDFKSEKETVEVKKEEDEEVKEINVKVEVKMEDISSAKLSATSEQEKEDIQEEMKEKQSSCNGEITPKLTALECNSENTFVDNKKTDISCHDPPVSSPSVTMPSTSTPDAIITSGCDGNIFLQSIGSSKLSDLCNLTSSSSSLSSTTSSSTVSAKTEKSDDSKLVVNTSVSHTSPSTLITPYSSAPPIFFPSSFNPSMNGPLCSSIPSLPPTSSPLPAHQHPKSSTPSGIESKSSFLSIDTLLKKDSGPSCTTSTSSLQTNNHFLQTPLFPVLPVSPDQMLKTFGDMSGEQKPWFSILPRMPCDDLSLTQGSSQVSGMPSPFGAASPFFSPLPLRAFPLHSPSFASFQMGQIYGSPSEFSGISSNNTTSSPQVSNDSSFKVPNTPKTDCDVSFSTSQLFDQSEYLMKDLQGEKQPIPEEMKSGWWRITDAELVRTVQRCCHPRGIREKNLQKTIQKFFDYALDSCSVGNKEVISLESSDEDDEDDDDDEEEQEEESKDDTSDDKKNESKTDEKDEEDNEETNEKNDNKDKKKKQKVKPPVEHREWLPEVAHQVELAVLAEVENLVERVASASLQVKGWKVPSRVQDDAEVTLVDRTKTDLKENELYPLDVARGKLLHLEPNIERRYLKPPLCKAVQINLASLTAPSDNRGDHSRRNSTSRDEEDDEEAGDQDYVERPEDIPPGLTTWRTAVATATSPAQLTLCVHLLNNSISWEKSIMKVLCQICRKDDNEAELLLCDGCDQGYHTYCFKPKMDTIPDGDWYCYECIGKATGDPTCIVCGKKTGKIAECYHCPRAIHLDCLDPPLPRMPRKWVCPACSMNQSGKKRQRKSPKKKTQEGGNIVAKERRDSDASSTSASKAPDTPVAEKKRGKEAEKKKAAEQSDDMTLCRLILTEMEKHEDGWPFLKPVNFKQFPTYKRYIKQPMDFSTMKNKLRDSIYKTRAEFAADTRLIFDNCKTFNEDESEVGRAGHTLRKFFESRWKELLLNASSNSSSSSSSSSLSSSTSTANSVTSVSSTNTSLTTLSSSSQISLASSSSSSTEALITPLKSVEDSH